MRKFKMTALMAAILSLQIAPAPAASSVPMDESLGMFASDMPMLSLPVGVDGGSTEIFGLYKTYSDSSCSDYFATVWGFESLKHLIAADLVRSYRAWPCGSCMTLG